MKFSLENRLKSIPVSYTHLWMLGLNITLPVIAGALLVVAGTMWSKWCFAKKEKVR